MRRVRGARRLRFVRSPTRSVESPSGTRRAGRRRERAGTHDWSREPPSEIAELAEPLGGLAVSLAQGLEVRHSRLARSFEPHPEEHRRPVGGVVVEAAFADRVETLRTGHGVELVPPSVALDAHECRRVAGGRTLGPRSGAAPRPGESGDAERGEGEDDHGEETAERRFHRDFSCRDAVH